MTIQTVRLTNVANASSLRILRPVNHKQRVSWLSRVIVTARRSCYVPTPQHSRKPRLRQSGRCRMSILVL